MPGTEMKVTPEMGAPIMAMATINQGAWCPPVRAVLVSLLREASHEMMKRMMKYPTRVARTMVAFCRSFMLLLCRCRLFFI